MKYAFENLEVWKKSRIFVKEIYGVTKLYPQEEKFGLTNQLRRASVSISSNIAEGSTRLSNRDKSRFYEVAYGSLIEVLNQLILSYDLEFLSNDNLTRLRTQIEELSRMLLALHKSASHPYTHKP